MAIVMRFRKGDKKSQVTDLASNVPSYVAAYLSLGTPFKPLAPGFLWQE